MSEKEGATGLGLAAAGDFRLSGKVIRVFFTNPEAPWMSGILRQVEGGDIRFSGKVAAKVGDEVELTGRHGRHPKYGEQFEAQTGCVRLEETPDALVQLLARHEDFAGIGPSRARAIVDAALALGEGNFGAALTRDPIRVAERANVPFEIVQRASEAWAARAELFGVLASLVELGWTTAQAHAMVRALGVNAVGMAKDSPYALIGRVPRFGFRTVDTVATKNGVQSDDPARLAAGVAYCLDRIAEDGHTWTKRDGLIDAAIAELRPNTLDVEIKIGGALDELIRLGTVTVSTSPIGSEVVADSRLMASEIAVFEDLIKRLESPAPPLRAADQREKLSSLNEDQARAVAGIFSRLCVVLSGGAGVGKTYTVRTISDLAIANGLRVGLCAPTGKAAKRLSESTGRVAKTIHRMLEPIFENGEFRFTRNTGNPLEVDLLVVDEVSMVDVRLMSRLLAALPSRARLVLVGDHNQIPSVGPGAILRDILAVQSRYPESIHVLRKVVRQAGVLAKNTCAILDGLVSPIECPSWGFLRTEAGHVSGPATQVAELVEALVTSAEPLEPFGRLLDPAWDVQVLAPMKDGPLGTKALNVELQKLRQRLLGNAPPPPVERDKPAKPQIGDKVIWTQNDYELDLMNGTQAIVLEFPKGGSVLIQTDDDREIEVPTSKRDRMQLAYALTIHKCVAGETLIETEHGWSRIDDLRFYDLREDGVGSFERSGAGLVATSSGPQGFDRFFCNEEDELIEIVAEGGYSLIVTPDHKLRTFSGERWEWVEARDLRDGSWLRIKLGESGTRRSFDVVLPPCPEIPSRATKITTPKILTEDVAEFFGLMVADGTRYAAGIRLAKRHLDVVERFASLGERLFGLSGKRSAPLGTPHVEFNSVVLSEWLCLVGGMDPNEKSIPACVMLADRATRGGFLRGLFEDGTVNVKGSKVDHIEWTNSSAALVRTVQTLLLEFGIISSIRTDLAVARLYIYGRSVVAFRDLIGFVSEFKNERLRGYSISGDRRLRVPIVRSSFSCSTGAGQNARYRGYVSRAGAEELGMHAELVYHYVRVRSLGRRRGRSYCLSVPMARAFLQNRFDGSNSQGSEWSCVILAIASSHFVMRDRNLLYTGASRASESLTIVGDLRGIHAFASAQKSERRQTFGLFIVNGWRRASSDVAPRE